MNVTVYTNRTDGEIRNFWNHIVFHPTDAIEDDWGQKILNQIAEDRAAKTVRIYNMFEDIVTLGEDGQLAYDYTLNDYRIDYLLAHGFTPMISYAFVPPFMAQNASETSSMSKNKKRYKGKMIVTSPPKDYKLWETLCYEYTAHLVSRYGEDTVASWRLQCWNEPDIKSFWMKDEPDVNVRCAEYCRLYDGFEAGLRAVSEKLCIGGPALAKHIDFLELFLAYIRKSGKKLDFISFHDYGVQLKELQAKTGRISAANHLERIDRICDLVKKYGFSDLPLIMDEWGMCSHGFANTEECPDLICRENEVFSAYFAKMITLFDEKRIPIEKMMICLSGQHEMVTDFSGFRNFFTLNFFRKPIYNAFSLAAKLGDIRLSYRTDGECPDLSVLTTGFADGNKAILLSCAAEHFDSAWGSVPVKLTFDGLDAEYRVRLWVIDRTHANAIQRYEELGAPEHPDEAQIAELRRAGELYGTDAPDVGRDNREVSFAMTDNSVVLCELIRK